MDFAAQLHDRTGRLEKIFVSILILKKLHDRTGRLESLKNL